MPIVVGVTFRRAGRVYYFDPGGFPLREGDAVITDTSRGHEFGVVVVGRTEVSGKEIGGPLKPVVRLATREDGESDASNREREREALGQCYQAILRHELPMKLVTAEYTFDRSRLTFHFSAEGRVDFRELVRELAGIFRTRIEMHQIGVRDEAKLLGGFGCCGRELCCATFLRGFDPVAIRMAKDQGLSLNPAKISGACGRLMCCLRYEHETYGDALRSFPKDGSWVRTPRGCGQVCACNIIADRLTVRYSDDRVEECPRAEAEVLAGAPSPAEMAATGEPQPAAAPAPRPARPPRRQRAPVPGATPEPEAKPEPTEPPGEMPQPQMRRPRRRRASRRREPTDAAASQPQRPPEQAAPADKSFRRADGPARRKRARQETSGRSEGPTQPAEAAKKADQAGAEPGESVQRRKRRRRHRSSRSKRPNADGKPGERPQAG